MEDRYRPPHRAGANERNSCQIVAFVAAPSTRAVVPSGFTAPQGGGVWVTFVADQACRICFGDSNVGATTTSDFLIPPNVPFRWWCSFREDTHFRVIRVSVDGNLNWYTSD